MLFRLVYSSTESTNSKYLFISQAPRTSLSETETSETPTEPDPHAIRRETLAQTPLFAN